jgi:hypothetical protein
VPRELAVDLDGLDGEVRKHLLDVLLTSGAQRADQDLCVVDRAQEATENGRRVSRG